MRLGSRIPAPAAQAGANERHRLERLDWLGPALIAGNQIDGSGTLALKPIFYFHLHNDMDVPDEEGLELESLDDAHAHAMREARNLFAQNVSEQGRVTLTHRIDIEDEHGSVLGTVRFGEAVQVEP